MVHDGTRKKKNGGWSLHHLHDLPNESVNAGCTNMLCVGAHMTDSFSCTFTPSPVTTPETKLNEEPGEKGDNMTDL